MARSQISGPHAAINSLLAVTTDLRFSMAAFTRSAAAPVPPTSSATMWTSECVTTSRQSVVLKTGPRPSGSFLECTERLHTATTFRRYPSLSAIWSPFSTRMASVLEPTLPSPTMPTFTSCIQVHDTKAVWRVCFAQRQTLQKLFAMIESRFSHETLVFTLCAGPPVPGRFHRCALAAGWTSPWPSGRARRAHAQRQIAEGRDSESGAPAKSEGRGRTGESRGRIEGGPGKERPLHPFHGHAQ